MPTQENRIAELERMALALEIQVLLMRERRTSYGKY
jgi:hypothetical protein